eukprot:UN19244
MTISSKVMCHNSVHFSNVSISASGTQPPLYEFIQNENQFDQVSPVI